MRRAQRPHSSSTALLSHSYSPLRGADSRAGRGDSSSSSGGGGSSSGGSGGGGWLNACTQRVVQHDLGLVAGHRCVVLEDLGTACGANFWLYVDGTNCEDDGDVLGERTACGPRVLLRLGLLCLALFTVVGWLLLAWLENRCELWVSVHQDGTASVRVNDWRGERHFSCTPGLHAYDSGSGGGTKPRRGAGSGVGRTRDDGGGGSGGGGSGRDGRVGLNAVGVSDGDAGEYMAHPDHYISMDADL